jgi:phage terminase small subunit
MDINRKLTAKQEAFCQDFIISNNALESYQKVYSTNGSKANQIKMAFEVRHNPSVEARIAELQELARQRNNVTVDRIVNRLACHAFTDFTEIADYENGRMSLHSFKNLTPQQRACIKEFKLKTVTKIVDEEYVDCDYVEIKLYDQQKALDMLGKHLGMFTEKIETTHKFTGPSPIIFGDTSKPNKDK